MLRDELIRRAEAFRSDRAFAAHLDIDPAEWHRIRHYDREISQGVAVKIAAAFPELTSEAIQYAEQLARSKFRRADKEPVGDAG